MIPDSNLSLNIYKDKVRACWLGKSIGGALGTPFEGDCGPFKLEFYDPIPGAPIPNDDLEFQLCWLSLAEQHGLKLDH